MLTTSEFSIFLLVTVSVETDLSLAVSETPKTGFSHDEAQVYVYPFYTFLPVISHFLHLGYNLVSLSYGDSSIKNSSSVVGREIQRIPRCRIGK